MTTESIFHVPEGSAFPELFREHFDALVVFLMARSDVGRHGAEDLAQEAMVRAWRSMPMPFDDMQAVGPWLRVVARRIAIDANRARRARPEEVLCGPLPGLADRAATAGHDGQVLDRVTVRSLLCRLSPRHRAVVELFYLRDLDIRTISWRLSIPEGTVKSRLYHALRVMRREYGHAHEETAVGP